jgi:hypothetical protein
METIKNSEWSRNGKGDDERPMDRKKFRANFDEIDWLAHRNKKSEDIVPSDDDRAA